MGVINTEYSDQPCWMREYCIHRSAGCLCSQPEDDGCPVYRCFKRIFEKQGLLVQNDKEAKIMITAEEARARARQVSIEKELPAIEQKILDAIEKQYICINVSNISEDAINELKSLGYTVQCKSDGESSGGWNIYWDKQYAGG